MQSNIELKVTPIASTFRELRRAPKSYAANEQPQIYSAHKCLLKEVENHALSVALHYMNYNFCRIHKTLRVTPAMAAGVTDRLWLISDRVQVEEDWENTT